MKIIKKEGKNLIFRINSWIYPEKVIKAVFGKEKDRAGRYLIFEYDSNKHSEKEILEKMNLLILKVMG